jgi:hypothetical protein
VNVRFTCPECETAARLELPGPAEWQCPACGHSSLIHGEALQGGLSACAVCGNAELYKKKDFPHGLGLFILAAACLASVVPYSLYMIWLVWVILLGSLAFDFVLYRLVGDVVVCYRCHAHYRGLPSYEGFPPHDLGTAERYRQEKIRRAQLQAAKRAAK